MADREQTEDTAITNVRHSDLRNCGEEELMRALCSGDGDALGLIFDRYHRLVLAVALRILRDIGEAEDLMQSVFFEIFQKAAQFDPAKGTLNKWILQYAYHRSINRKNYLQLRHFHKTIDVLDADAQELWITDIAIPAQETSRLVSELLALLNGPQREVMELVFFGDLSLKEIAEQTKQSFAAVRHQYYRGLKQLRHLLSDGSSVNGKKAILGLKGEVGGANA